MIINLQRDLTPPLRVVRKLVAAGTSGKDQVGEASAVVQPPKEATEEQKVGQEATKSTEISDVDTAKAEVAAEVADSAQKLDEGKV